MSKYIEPTSNKILFNINPYDYLQPLKLQKDNSYYNELLDSITIKQYSSYLKNKEILPLSDVNDIIMTEYIKCFNDNNIIVVYPNALQKSSDSKTQFFNLLHSNGNIYYVKPLKISYYHAYNLIYNLYAHTDRMKKNSAIIYRLERLGFKNDGYEHDILIIVYQHLNKEKSINGSTSPFKSLIRKVFLDEDLKITKFESTSDKYPREYDYLHVNDTFHECINYSYLFLHKNTIDFISNQQSWRLLLLEKGQMLFNNFCSIIFTLPLIERNKIMLMSSTVLFSYGVRVMNDIDGIIDDTINIDTNTIDKLNKNNIDIYYGAIQGNKNETWENELNNRAKLFGASDYNELIRNPKYHYYFMGIKMLKLDHEIMIRKKRLRPAQMTDLLIINRLLFMNYSNKKNTIKGSAIKLEIPIENKIYDEKTQSDIISKVDKSTYVSTVQHYLKSRYNLIISIPNIITWIESSEELQTYIENPHIIPLKENLQIIPTPASSNLYSTYKNISFEKIIFPSIDTLIKLGYINYTSILADNKPYIYPGEDWINQQSLCYKEPNEIYQKSPNRLRVASFNVHNFISRCNQGIAPVFFNNLNMFTNGRNIYDFLQLFKKINADVLCLQEFVPIFHKELTNDITDYNQIQKINFEFINNEMNKLGYTYSCIADTQQGRFSTNEPRSYFMLCNAIYSKLPILEEKIFKLFINRNIVSIKVHYNNKDVWILNTHCAYFNENTPESIQLKKDMIVLQFETIQTIIQNEYKLYQNLIFCGDFNINFFKKGHNYRYKNYDTIKNLMLENFNNSFKVNLPTNFSQNDQTDFILISKQSTLYPKYSLVVYSTLSDHFPIFTDFN
jgi:endonuclease/exonuclease/phosphatase family metal-dependent hydrolase